MRIDHTALYVYDLETARAFFIRYFGAVSGDRYHNPKTGLSTYFLTFSTGARLELMTHPQLTRSAAGPYIVGFAHLAFALDSRTAVDTLTARLSNDGYTVESGPRTTGDGYYESCVLGPEGCRLELTV